MFYQKVLNIIYNKSYDEIVKDHFLIRHFLRNQKDDSLFSDIIDKIVPTVIKDKEGENQDVDSSNKRKLIEYFENFGSQHTDNVIDVLIEMTHKAKTLNLKRRIGMAIEKLKKPLSIVKLFHLAIMLLQEKDPMVRDFTARSLQEFVNDFSSEQNKELIEIMFFNKVDEKDVVQGSVSLQMKFQGRDLAYTAFRESAKYLGLAIENTAFTMDLLPLFMKIHDQYLSEDLPEKQFGKLKHHFTWRLGDAELGNDNREYESDPKKRLSLELRDKLINLESEAQEIFQEVCEYIIEKAEYVGYFEILVRVLEDKQEKYPEIIKKIIMYPDVLMVVDTQKRRRHSFIQDYLSTHTDDVDEYEQRVNSIDLPDNKPLEKYNKARAFFAIPKANRAKKINKYIKDFEIDIAKEHNLEKRKMEVSKESDMQTRTYREEKEKIDTEWFNQKREVQDLVDKLVEYNKTGIFSINDAAIYMQYSEYFKVHKDQLSEFYQKISTEQPSLSGKWFGSYLIDGQIKAYQEELGGNKEEFYEHITNLYDIFENNSSAKLNIARVLETDECLRAKYTGEMKEKKPGLFKKIKELVIKLSQDKDPEKEENQGFSIMLNSVRGVATILVSILAHYYPDDEELLNQIRELSEDNLIGIKAAVVENLVYLISKKYDFCEEIIEKFENDRDVTIDQSLIRYMFRLGNEKLQNKIPLLEKIAGNKDDEVRQQLGALIGQAYAHKLEMGEIINKLVSGKFGDVNTVVSFAMQLENEIPSILSFAERKDMIEPILLCYNKLLTDYQSEDEEHHSRVANRLSFLFYDERLRPEYFKTLDTYNVFEIFIGHGEMTGQSNLNKYLLRCVKNNIDLGNKIVELLKEQIKKHPTILVDEYHGKSIADIVEYLLGNEKRSKILDEVFDEGLKYGSKAFYDIFDKYYKDRE